MEDKRETLKETFVRILATGKVPTVKVLLPAELLNALTRKNFKPAAWSDEDDLERVQLGRRILTTTIDDGWHAPSSMKPLGGSTMLHLFHEASPGMFNNGEITDDDDDQLI